MSEAPETESSGELGLVQTLLVPALLVAVLWGVELLDAVLPGRWDSHGIRPRSDEGVVGIVLAPLLHDGWGHLMANTLPLLVLGTLLAFSGLRTFVTVTAIVWTAGGAGSGCWPARTATTSAPRGWSSDGSVSWWHVVCSPGGSAR